MRIIPKNRNQLFSSCFWMKLMIVALVLLTGSFWSTASGQSRRVTGKIISASDNLPLPGATVKIRGTQNATITDVKGEFSMDVSDTASLVVSFIGFNSQLVAVAGRSNLSITLAEDSKMLAEVVTMGYSTMKKSDVSSAQVSIGSEELRKTTVTSLDQAIQGRAAGVYVTQNTGAPGGAVSVNIRGINSISGSNEPMYVVDGIQIMGDYKNNALSGINPDDIESINILQGPQATSLYGSRAANGVVVVTTKKGKAGETKVQYNGNYSVQMLPNFLPTMNLREYATYMNAYADVTGQTPNPEFADPSVLGEGTNWQKELFQVAPTQKHQLSLSGGNDKTTFYISTEYFDQKGVAYGSGFNRYSLRLNVDNQTRDWLKIGSNINLSQTNMVETFGEASAQNDGNLISTAIAQAPNVPVRNPDGSWGGPTETQYQLTNPVAIAEMNANNTRKRNALGNFYAEITLFKGLKLRNELNGNILYENKYKYAPSYQFGGFVFDQTQANSSREANNNFNWNFLSMLTYTKEIGRHNFDIMVAHEAQETNSEQLSGYRSGFVNNTIQELSAGDKTTADNSSSKSSWAMESYLGQLHYIFNKMVIFTGSVRRDGSTNFGDAKRWGTFPSGSVALVVSQMPYFKDIKELNNLKVRFEYGVTGNQGAGSYAYLAKLKSKATTWGTGFVVDNYANPNLQWEETKQGNVGFDLNMFNNRVEVVVDLYKKEINNLLMEEPLPAYMGTSGSDQDGVVSKPWVNIGAMENKGLSITLNTINVESPLTWRTGFTFTLDRNKLTKLYNQSAKIDKTSSAFGSFMQRAEIGQPLWQYYVYEHQGLFQSLDEIRGHATQNVTGAIDAQSGTWVGDVKFLDYNGDGVIDENDRHYLGNPYPKFSGGFSNTLQYKGFELYAFFTGVYGNKIYNWVRRRNESLTSGPGWNKLRAAADFARIGTDASGNPYIINSGTNIQRITGTQDPNGNGRSSNFFIEDGSFIKLKNVQLSYTFSKAYFEKLKLSAVQGVRLAAGIQNVFTLTHYKGYDPEIGSIYDSSSNYTFVGVDNGRYPQTRIYTFSVQLNF